MRFLFKLLRVVPYEYINEQMADIVAAESLYRQERTTAALNEIAALESSTTLDQVKKIISNFHKDLDNSYAKERQLMHLIKKLKA